MATGKLIIKCVARITLQLDSTKLDQPGEGTGDCRAPSVQNEPPHSRYPVNVGVDEHT